jgi:hypothetical protein
MMFEMENRIVNKEKDKETLVARKYRGAGESTPRIQVYRMPPKLPMIVVRAMEVARLVRGAALLLLM